MLCDKLVDVNDPYACQCKNIGCQGKSGPGKIHEVILIQLKELIKQRQHQKPKEK